MKCKFIYKVSNTYCKIIILNFFKRIQEYQTYQPVFTRRLNNENKSEFLDKYASNLSESSNSSSTASSKITVEDWNTYYIFFVMAQIGGLYSFLKFSIGSIFSLITDKMLLISFINNLRQCKSNSKLNNLSKKKRSKRVLPTFNIEKVYKFINILINNNLCNFSIK